MANLENNETTELIETMARAIHELLLAHFGENIGFILHVFEFKANSVCRYVTNAQREQMIDALQVSIENMKQIEDFENCQKNKVGNC